MLPEPVLRGVQEVYGIASAELFLIGAPIASLAVVAVLFIKEKPLSTLTGDQRRAKEEAAAAAAGGPLFYADVMVDGPARQRPDRHPGGRIGWRFPARAGRAVRA